MGMPNPLPNTCFRKKSLVRSRHPKMEEVVDEATHVPAIYGVSVYQETIYKNIQDSIGNVVPTTCSHHKDI